jgi:hypothetical protein
MLLDLEMLHRNLPLIKSLCLSHLSLVAGGIPQGVMPANALTKINLDLIRVSDLATHTPHRTTTWRANTLSSKILIMLIVL